VGAPLDVAVTEFVGAPPQRVRAVMFDPRLDPQWMAAVTAVQPLGDAAAVGTQVRRTGRFLGRTLRWTTEITAVSSTRLDLAIVDGPMRGTVAYQIDADGDGSRVTIRNVGRAPGFAPRWLLRFAMRRALAADLRRLKQIVEQRL
jgi:Polyketide cyclase / dehydrase and lipid transport